MNFSVFYTFAVVMVTEYIGLVWLFVSEEKQYICSKRCLILFGAGADPGWSVTGGVEAKIGRKGANFARFWPILEGAAPPRPPTGSTTVVLSKVILITCSSAPVVVSLLLTLYL